MSLSTAFGDSIAHAVDAAEKAALSVANPVAFGLRQTLRFRRSGHAESPDSATAIPPSLARWSQGPRATELAERYGCDRHRGRLSLTAQAEIVAFADLLDRALEHSALLRVLPQRPLRILDVGCKNFLSSHALLPILSRAVSRPLTDVQLTGIEVDAYRVYRCGHSRHDAASYYLSLLPRPRNGRHRFLPMDVLAHSESHDVITWFKPFVTPYPLLRWGLPRSLLRPHQMLRHVIDLLAPGGTLVIVNQAEEENDVQLRLLEEHDFPRESFELTDVAAKSGHAVYCHVLSRRVS